MVLTTVCDTQDYCFCGLIQCLRLALSKGPNREDVYHPLT
jgi:hypothetical protein